MRSKISNKNVKFGQNTSERSIFYQFLMSKILLAVIKSEKRRDIFLTSKTGTKKQQ